MEYFLIFFGLLAIGCTFVLYMTISVHGKKISDIHKALSKVHLKVLNVESDVNVIRKQKNFTRKNRVYQSRESRDQRVKKEVVYRVPKKISGDLTMHHKGQSASVRATLKVKDTE